MYYKEYIIIKTWSGTEIALHKLTHFPLEKETWHDELPKRCTNSLQFSHRLRESNYSHYFCLFIIDL